ncbi:MAG: hypothetical protein ACRDV8_03930 [Acidimicrobiales bacterium]
MPSGHVVVVQADLDRLHDRLYTLEAALDDLRVDLADVTPSSTERRRSNAYGAALAHLRAAAEDLRGVLVEPVAD